MNILQNLLLNQKSHYKNLYNYQGGFLGEVPTPYYHIGQELLKR
jgi:hypothetical protein